MRTPADLDDIRLDSGSHTSFRSGHCLMEVVAWAAGEKHTDHPACVSPVLLSFGMRLNDALPDADRQLLKPYIFRVIGTAGDGKDEARAALAREWLMTSALPEWLELANLGDLATKARDAASLTGPELRTALRSIRDLTREARREARAQRTERIKTAILAKWAEEGKQPAAAVAAAVADAAADAAAVAVAVADAVAVAAAVAAAAAVADADAVAAAVAAADADAVADADAAAVAAAVAAADAVADAVAAAVADAVADAGLTPGTYAYRSEIYNAVYTKMREHYKTIGFTATIEALRDKQRAELFELYDRMIDAA